MKGGEMKKRAFCVMAALFLMLFFVPAAQSSSFTISEVGWVEQSSGTAQDLRSVSAGDASTAWAVGASCTILKTTDGSTWNPQTTVVPATNDLYGIDALDDQNAFATGDDGMVFKTSNGTDWATTPLSPT
jgi:photosystem II stability/assembly factor-like uncharacterized protein